MTKPGSTTGSCSLADHSENALWSGRIGRKIIARDARFAGSPALAGPRRERRRVALKAARKPAFPDVARRWENHLAWKPSPPSARDGTAAASLFPITLLRTHRRRCLRESGRCCFALLLTNTRERVYSVHNGPPAFALFFSGSRAVAQPSSSPFSLF